MSGDRICLLLDWRCQAPWSCDAVPACLSALVVLAGPSYSESLSSSVWTFQNEISMIPPHFGVQLLLFCNVVQYRAHRAPSCQRASRAGRCLQGDNYWNANDAQLDFFQPLVNDVSDAHPLDLRNFRFARLGSHACLWQRCHNYRCTSSTCTIKPSSRAKYICLLS